MTGKSSRTTNAKRRASPARLTSPHPAAERTIVEILSRPYSWVVTRDANGRFSARITEFPACVTDGATRAEALANLEAAAHDWVKGALEDEFPIPEPQERERASGKILLRLPRDLHGRVQDMAASNGVSANTFLVYAISEQVGGRAIAANILKQVKETLSFATAIAGAPQAANMVSVTNDFDYRETVTTAQTQWTQ